MSKFHYETSIFLNCPFDDQFEPLFRAAVFTIMDCGFQVRCSLEVVDASQIRLQKIYALIEACKYGIHDLSRVQIDESSQLPRFNMPLEFGIFLGAKVFGNKLQKQKICLVFDSTPYRYQKYVSDISGQDIESHENDPKVLIGCIRNWLASLYKGVLPSSRFIWERYQRFQRELVGLCEAANHSVEELTYLDLLKHIQNFGAQKVDVLETGLQNRWGKNLSEPSLPHIREAIESLTEEDDSFIILKKSGSGMSYMQVAGCKKDGYQLEYQEGSLDHHYRCNQDLDENQIVTAFQAYRRSENRWKTDLNWERLKLR